ncbi:class I SAM-dependent methyltransferase [bacterium]|nr:class I SAM-dependent methyltransferase [bacterium]
MKSLAEGIARCLPRPLAQAARSLWRRLPPKDKRYLLQDLETEKKRGRFLKSREYREFCEIEGRFWAGFAEETDQSDQSDKNSPATLGHFLEHSVAREMFYRAPGLAAPDFWQWLKSHGRTFDRVFVPAAGEGLHARILIDMGLAKEVAANDISEQLAARAQREYEKLNYNIKYIAGDLNTISLPAGRYDACVAIHALHHVIGIEHLARELAGSLKPGGELFMEDYVGPRWLQYPDSVKQHVRRWHAMLPDRLKLDRSGAVIRELHFRDQWEVQKNSPFESIRSDAILPALMQYFNINEKYNLGGGLVMPLLEQTIHNYNPADEEANAWLRKIMAEDKKLAASGEIPNFFVLAGAKPR